MVRLLFIWLLLYAPATLAEIVGGNSQPSPNIVVILADDLGWNDVGYHGSEIRTPNLDELAANGVVLSQYRAQPTCSPTRAALMTGKSPQSMGVYRQFAKNATQGLPAEERTIANYLSEAGYQTWLVGKWHLGYLEEKYQPNSRGFDHFYGHVTGGIGYWDHVHGGGLDWQRNGVTVREEGYSTHLLSAEAVSLIENRDESKPFFLYASFNAPHLPNEAPPESVEAYGNIGNPFRQQHAAMVTELDAGIGEIVDALYRSDQLDNTLIWFMSDNGGLNEQSMPDSPLLGMARWLDEWVGAPVPVQFLEFIRTNALEGGSDNGPFRHGKASVYEGGVRVPSLLHWPNRLKASTSHAFVTVEDVMPTVLTALGITYSESLNGKDRLPVIVGERSVDPSDYVIRGQFDDQAYYQWPWKLISTADGNQLYHMENDPIEARDLASEYPSRVSAMNKLLENWPRGESVHIPVYKVFLDPDFFGGQEDRVPWADLANSQNIGGDEYE